MYAKVYTGAAVGIDGILVAVEADAGDGLPSFEMVGYLASEVREARERVRTAMKNSGYPVPPCRLTVSLSPADLRKHGNSFDLPIAAAILTACGYLPKEAANGWLLVGELGLDGSLKPVAGTLTLAGCGSGQGITKAMVPAVNAPEAACCPGIRAVGVHNLKEAVRLLQNPEEAVFAVLSKGSAGMGKSDGSGRNGSGGENGNKEIDSGFDSETGMDVDFSELKGQCFLRRASEVAAAGLHNILYLGPPGSGKTMAARRLATILPSMSQEEQVEISKIYSLAGMLDPAQGLIAARPFRAPHHSVTLQAMTGGGPLARPGEISLASGGILFLDELPEFPRQILEALRQPLEDGVIAVSRLRNSIVYPARLMLAAAMNPCPCGYYPDRRRCRCSKGSVDRYLSRVSQPLLDRMDICAEAGQTGYTELSQEAKEESSAQIRARVERAAQIQRERYKNTGIRSNASLPHSALSRYCRLNRQGEALLAQAFETLGLSARAHDRILRVARTIADLAGEEQIREEHLSEAIGYRGLDKKYWGL